MTESAPISRGPMADTISKQKRSEVMSRIKRRDTKPELTIRKSLFQLGLRYRVDVGDLPGRPDLYFPRFRAVLFVHGCFWHRHNGCKFAYTPKSNLEFWETKFRTNIDRDLRALKRLHQLQLRVGVVWECAISGPAIDALSSVIASWLRTGTGDLELP